MTDRQLEETYKKEEKIYRVYGNYRINLNEKLITAKFYSKYDHLDLSRADETIVKLLERHREMLPNQRYPVPPTENYCYGWYASNAVTIDKMNANLYQPRMMSEFVKHEIRIQTGK